MSCAEFWPAPACSWRGKCEPLPGDSEICVCDKGWENTKELNFFTNKEVSICIYSPDLSTVLYSAALGLTVFGLVVGLSTVNSRKKLRNYLAWTCYCVLVVSLCVYRLVDDNALLGVDVVFSLLWTLIVKIFAWLSYKYYMSKLAYVKFKARRLKLEMYYLGKLERGSIFTWKAILGVMLFSNSFWIAAVLDNENLSLILIRVFIFFQASIWLFFAIFLFLSFSEIETDCKTIISGAVTQEEKQSMETLAQVTVPKLKRLKIRFIVIYGTGAIVWGLGLISDFWFQCLIYFVPISISLAAIGNLLMVLNRLTQANETTASSTNLSTSENRPSGNSQSKTFSSI
mmetsp:Transcript_6393/g.8399  ORF Transcript_6393/g.8399 Transcript_6393/m.8399 type:complete len:343 (+) Transcript_6393:216-1244(+)